ncbi:hypothetical protein C8Q74DRAFT_797877 [Fomes fomentarius]|nr:hypothetical protein C8Q74DRAFT_797877 [Fomes fomentarius]
MSDEEDDYLSDKFLIEAAPASSSSAPKTYVDRRKETLRRAAQKNEENRKKSRREREREAREEALNRSLFERAQEEAKESGQQNKALAMMLKMGFKPGKALGKDESEEHYTAASASGSRSRSTGDADEDGDGDGEAKARPASLPRVDEREVEPVRAGIGARPAHDALEVAAQESAAHRKVPLALNEWQGKTGIGLRKRAASPSASERLAKMAKMAEDRTHGDFRDRARQEYEERRAVGRLHPAQRTCATLDEKFNVLWLNPESPETFPAGLLDALDEPALVTSIQKHHANQSIEGRLRAKMQADALQPLKSSLEDVDADDSAEKVGLPKSPYSEEDLQEAVQFLRLGAQDRLTLVLDYLRRKYAYCFWCGTQYDDAEDMENNCPGPNEDAHD